MQQEIIKVQHNKRRVPHIELTLAGNLESTAVIYKSTAEYEESTAHRAQNLVAVFFLTFSKR